ncbi:MAG: hypothetical protein ACE5KE_00575 [Methanosarcinales archaeon]
MLECDICGKPAVVNFQKLWVEYPILDAKEEKYGTAEILDGQSPDGEDNEFRCEEHRED